MFVHYSKTKAEFIAAGLATTYNNNIVFIKGDANGNGSCIYTHGTYFANFKEFIDAYVGAMNYVKGINVGGQSYNAAAGGGYVAFGAADPTTVAVNAGSNGVEIGLTTAFVTKVNDTATNLGTKDDAANSEGSAFARIANLAQLVADLTGGSVDSIEGQITKAIDALRTEITGDLTDATDAKTLAAINDELNGIDALYAALEPRVKAIEDDYLKAADKTELGNRITNEAPVTIAEAAGTGDVLKTYTFTQNGKEIGKINLAKELVVTGGEIVEIDGVKNLQLTIANQTAPVNIPVNELVDVYTNGYRINISDANVISLDIDGVKEDLIDDGFYRTTTGVVNRDDLDWPTLASLGKADTAYQKPSAGIPATDLDSGTQTKITRAGSAITTISNGDHISAYVNPNGTASIGVVTADEISGSSSIPTDNAVKTYVDAQWEWEEL